MFSKNYDEEINELKAEIKELKDEIFNLTSNPAYAEMLQKYDTRERKNFEKAKKILKSEEIGERNYNWGCLSIQYRHLKIVKDVYLTGEVVYRACLGNFKFSSEKAEKLYELYELLR